MEKRMQDSLCDSYIEFMDTEAVYGSCDFIIVLGGDGSILRAAKNAITYGKSVLGINLGRVGYMAELEKDEISLISNVFTNNYSIEKRMTVSVSVRTESGSAIDLGTALNDVVIERGSYSQCADLSLFADGKNVRAFRADGLIISTPTGSTAYSMAAGGSVLDPTLECICATPICPISRYACPTIFSGNSVLEITHKDERIGGLVVSVDGEALHKLAIGETLVVKKSEKPVSMISVKDEGFFETLNNKISQYELKG
ncbi:MAG: NAD(+)/NADH kinase [Clostridia bacterium]|nr:NAD(+)/NADH kinase [Clostridia bacterium]